VNNKRCWKTTVKVTVLSVGEYPPFYTSMEALDYDMNLGHCIGCIEQDSEEITEEETKKLAVDFGSAEEFLFPEEEELE